VTRSGAFFPQATLTFAGGGKRVEAVTDEMQIVHEYPINEMPKKRLLDLFKKGATLYKICENPECDFYQRYQKIITDKELMTYCLQCGRKVLLYGVEKTG
jgi:hypothetical protein